MSKLVSVIIPTYNRRGSLVAAIQSALDQTYEALEVIVVDDGSTDGTDEEIARLDGNIRYFRQQNKGVSAARNLGIRESTGELVAFLDSDDLWAATKLEKQVRVMEQSAEVGLVYCAFTRLDLLSGASKLFPCPPEIRGDVRRRLLQRSWVPPSAALVRRSCFDKAGFFDETLRSSEDWDLWIRVSRHFHFDYVPESLMTLRVQEDNLSKRISAVYENQLTVIHRAFREDPVDHGNRLLQQRVLAHYAFDVGREYYWGRHYRPAMRHLAQSIAQWPFSCQPHLFLARALVKQVIS